MTKATTFPADSGRDLNFTPGDFARVRDMIYRLAGISLSDSKQQMVYSRLSRRVRSMGCNDFDEYLDNIEAGTDEAEATEFINALTTNLTSFFREAYHFPLLAEHLRDRAGPIRVWCSAASTGEEPYSIAMTVMETLGKDSHRAEIIASDIDTTVLDRAMSGVYTMERVEKLSPERLQRFFLKGRGSNDGYIKVRPELRRMIEFRQLNLTHDNWGLPGPFDAVFCRNVMIYFDKETQASILRKVVPLMKPDGLLFAGHSENFQYVSTDLRPRGQTVYTLAEQKATQRERLLKVGAR